MKVSASILVASLAYSSAFTASPIARTSSSLMMSEEGLPIVEEAVVAPVEEETPVTVAPVAPVKQMSMSMPFMECPQFLDGSLAGDVGFDPLGFAKSTDDLMNFREAEIKHARLAMLAAAGWPLSELFDAKIAKVLGMAPLVDASDRAPSVLNGGLGKVSPVYWIACIAGAAAVDAFGIYKKNQGDAGYFPGNLGFDPFGVYPQDEAGQKRMQLAEIKNGRLAMIAITAFAFQEFVTQSGVIDETPVFFKPIGTVMQEYANYGYVVPK